MSQTNPEPTSSTDNEMPLMAHLIELRNRLLKIIIAVIVVFLGLAYWATDIYSFFAMPLLSVIPNSSSMIATDVLANFFAPFKLTFMLALFIAIPYVLSQIWGFIAPGLYKHEQRLAVPLMISSTLLFYSGILFAYYVVFPLAFGFLAAIEIEGVQTMPDITSYLNTILKLFFAFGVIFEIPVAILLMVKMGITTAQSLRDKRPYVIVGVFIIGMFLTPPDVISQVLLAFPMWALFELGIYLSRYITPIGSDNNSNESEQSKTV